MGCSSDGLLFYGICIDEDSVPEHWQVGDFDPSEIYAAAVGIMPPDVEHGEDPSVIKAYEDYWKRHREAHKASKCEVLWHCSYDYPMYAVVLSGTITRAYRGEPKEIKPGRMVVTTGNVADKATEDNLLRDYCEKMGVKYEQPRWWLASMYG